MNMKTITTVGDSRAEKNKISRAELAERLAAEKRWLRERHENEILAAHPEIGVLVRDGKRRFYATINGEYVERRLIENIISKMGEQA